MKHEKINQLQRRRRRQRVRNRVKRDSVRPRMSVFRSLKHIYVQIIDDENGKTLASASTADKEVRAAVGYGGNCQAARAVGKAIAQRALAAGINQVAFDRREYRYHGRVAALADAARDAGLDLGAKRAEAEPPPKEEPKKGKKQK
ncbi:MAG: 50S ribosomal protein L18 [Thermoguttaceae bacterium]